ncbi:hypothetical protein JZ786_19670 [Alicyclobacillus mengziensis]|uniref:Acyl-CoA dehydrogenase/oxidase C-terminal domain-containing protein n=1 Tax=Alicyclobacillus mengziensis TaxID=2931921 RepID=A0A9X7VX52_9BACL|nr:hypothetical protein JZ786_19670 [Alicyclobacillus mengziensis]
MPELIFDQCKIPRHNLLGEEGQGFAIAKRALQSDRFGMSAQALGIAEAAYDLAGNYVQTRVKFGHALSSHESIQIKPAEMPVKLETSRFLVC